MAGKKERLDVLLVERGFFESRERAKASIMAGTVFVDGQRSDKAGTKIDVEAEIDVKEDVCPYVSRGGYKLEKSIESFGIDLTGLTCMDIGASTGGFTDCMLQNGAKKVYAVDVGYGQLAWKLRTDPRVINIEKCNVRYLEPERIGEPVDFVSIDVSFISLKLILPVAKKVLKDRGRKRRDAKHERGCPGSGGSRGSDPEGRRVCGGQRVHTSGPHLLSGEGCERECRISYVSNERLFRKPCWKRCGFEI